MRIYHTKGCWAARVTVRALKPGARLIEPYIYSKQCEENSQTEKDFADRLEAKPHPTKPGFYVRAVFKSMTEFIEFGRVRGLVILPKPHQLCERELREMGLSEEIVVLEQESEGSASTVGQRLITSAFRGHQVRCVDVDGEVWFVVHDIMKPLGYREARNAIHGISEDDRGRFTIISHGRYHKSQDMLCVRWPGLYRMLLRSNKPNAKPFQEWVEREVLPGVVALGSYSEQQGDVDSAQALTKVVETIDKLNAKLDMTTSLLSQQITDVALVADARIAMHVQLTHGELQRLRERVELLEKGKLPSDEAPTLLPTALAEMLGVSAIAVNKALVAAGLQVKRGRGFVLTGKGESFGRPAASGHFNAAPKVHWVSKVKDEIKPYLQQQVRALKLVRKVEE